MIEKNIIPCEKELSVHKIVTTTCISFILTGYFTGAAVFGRHISLETHQKGPWPIL